MRCVLVGRQVQYRRDCGDLTSRAQKLRTRMHGAWRARLEQDRLVPRALFQAWSGRAMLIILPTPPSTFRDTTTMMPGKQTIAGGENGRFHPPAGAGAGGRAALDFQPMQPGDVAAAHADTSKLQAWVGHSRQSRWRRGWRVFGNGIIRGQPFGLRSALPI